jgi:hypothetical protein
MQNEPLLFKAYLSHFEADFGFAALKKLKRRYEKSEKRQIFVS